jgi:hypothetical protein
MKDTTTFEQFRILNNYYSIFSYPKIDSRNEEQKLDTRDKALDDLHDGKIEAFASDGVILRTLFEKGIDAKYDRDNKRQYRKKRPPYKDYKDSNQYSIFPSEAAKTLDHLDKEEYAIAIQKNKPYTSSLKSLIDQTLNRPVLDKEKQLITEFESDLTSQSPTDKKRDSKSNDDKDDDKPWVQILVAIISLIGVLGAAWISHNPRTPPSPPNGRGGEESNNE